MNKILLIVATLLLFCTSCKKEDQFKDALILDLGDPALDGCGWVVKIAEELHKPLNLSAEYQKDSLLVLIKYDLKTSKANCGLVPNAYYEVEIEDIQKK